jgi:acetylornithine deacetylase/succinyl-diaminopimelate desuccinylase-like protein
VLHGTDAKAPAILLLAHIDVVEARRDIKMALTCGEETMGAFDGAQYLATHHRDLIDAAFAVNEGGHSSRPVKDNAIYHLAGGLVRLGQYDFPIQLHDTTRAYFTRLSAIKGGEAGAAMAALVSNPADAAAAAIVTENPTWNGMLRTTCVATMLDAGHATNALPRRARANVHGLNERIRVQSVYDGRDFLLALVQLYAAQKP